MSAFLGVGFPEPNILLFFAPVFVPLSEIFSSVPFFNIAGKRFKFQYSCF